MASTESLSLDSPPSILVIGGNGSHKTFFAGSTPSPFIFDLDKNLTVLSGKKGIEYETFRDAAYVKPGKSGLMVMKDSKGVYPTGTAWQAFLNKHNEFGKMMDTNSCPFKTLVWDSLSFLTVMGMLAILKERGNLGESPTQPQYLALQELMLQTISQFMTWPVMKVVTAHVERMADEFDNKIKLLPFVPYGKKWPAMLPQYFNEIYYTRVVDGKFQFVTTASDQYAVAKSPFGVPDGTEATWDAIKQYYPQPWGTKKAA